MPTALGVARRALLGGLVLGAVAAAAASEVPAARGALVGHPRGRWPLAVHVAAAPDPALRAAVLAAVADWSRVSAERLGVPAFTLVDEEAAAQVVVGFFTGGPTRLMGRTHLDADAGGVIRLPVRIDLAAPVSRGQTPAERLLFQVAAHELGHALGLPHANDPRSLMCCDPGALDFGDPPTREAYLAARRQPEVASAGAQLAEHYRRFWGE